MEKVNRKKLAKAALLTAALVTGITTVEALFNEAQATGTKSWTWISKPGGGSEKVCGTLKGTEC